MCAGQGSSAVGGRCTTRRKNAHVTSERPVLYRWHPWFGRLVHVHQAIDKGVSGVFRCTLDGLLSGRLLELPAWMFERVSCLPMRLAPLPQVDCAALIALKTLLADAAHTGPSDAQPSNAPVPGAGRSPCPENRRDADATPTPSSTDPSVRIQTVRSLPPKGARAGVEPASSGRSGDGDELDGTAHRRARARRLPRTTSGQAQR